MVVFWWCFVVVQEDWMSKLTLARAQVLCDSARDPSIWVPKLPIPGLKSVRVKRVRGGNRRKRWRSGGQRRPRRQGPKLTGPLPLV